MSFCYELFIFGTLFLNFVVCDPTDVDYFPLKDLNIYQITNEIVSTHFEKFVTSFNRTYKYDSEEYARRLDIFTNNLATIYLLNRNEEGSAVYGVNEFADLTAEEFRKKHLGLRPELNRCLVRKNGRCLRNPIHVPEPDFPLPESFDWRDKGVVSPVKNQGQCGSCWAFSTTGNIESHHAIKSGELVELSEQELVDCDKVDKGCNGGYMETAFKTVMQIGGLETEKDYPYDGRDETCHIKPNKTRINIDSYVALPTDENKLAAWLVKNGPISIGINAMAMQFYFGGISHPWKYICNPSDINHGVLIVGYGVGKSRFSHKPEPYWIVKNSWGTKWGKKGYYYVYRGDGTCGLNSAASSAIINP